MQSAMSQMKGMRQQPMDSEGDIEEMQRSIDAMTSNLDKVS